MIGRSVHRGGQRILQPSDAGPLSPVPISPRAQREYGNEARLKRVLVGELQEATSALQHAPISLACLRALFRGPRPGVLLLASDCGLLVCLCFFNSIFFFLSF